MRLTAHMRLVIETLHAGGTLTRTKIPNPTGGWIVEYRLFDANGYLVPVRKTTIEGLENRKLIKGGAESARVGAQREYTLV